MNYKYKQRREATHKLLSIEMKIKRFGIEYTIYIYGISKNFLEKGLCKFNGLTILAT